MVSSSTVIRSSETSSCSRSKTCAWYWARTTLIFLTIELMFERTSTRFALMPFSWRFVEAIWPPRSACIALISAIAAFWVLSCWLSAA